MHLIFFGEQHSSILEIDSQIAQQFIKGGSSDHWKWKMVSIGKMLAN